MKIKDVIHKWAIEIAIFSAGLIAINLIFIPEAFRETGTLSTVGAGQLGDFVGGYVGTFFALVSVLLLTATLKNQRKSEELREFETKYFELIRLHRANVAEIKNGAVKGRRLFLKFFLEDGLNLHVQHPARSR